MKRYLTALSATLVLTSSIYLPNALATNSSTMLITIAESSPTLIERLNSIAGDEPKLLKSLLALADSNPLQLERLLNLQLSDPIAFQQLIEIESIKNSDAGSASLQGTISDGGIIRN